jgi:hypothetical protein
MAHRLDGCRTKITRSKEQMENLDAALKRFFNSNPYKITTKRDAETRRLVYYLSSVADVPVGVSVIAGEVLQGLRSALDHLAYQLVLVGTGQPGPFPHVYFPIFNSASDYESKKLGQIKGMRKEAIKAIDAIKPYKGGNDVLWRLHRLNQIDKHRLLIAVGSAFRSVDIGAIAMRDMAKLTGKDLPPLPMFLEPADRMYALKAGDELFIDLPDAEVDENLQFRCEVALGEPDVVEGEPLMETLNQMVTLVDSLVATFDPLLA